jgi:hypothetical protein
LRKLLTKAFEEVVCYDDDDDGDDFKMIYHGNSFYFISFDDQFWFDNNRTPMHACMFIADMKE